MLYLRTGLPGASKTLNTVKEIVEDDLYTSVQVYYNNIKLLFLDLDVCHSFSGFFYGQLLPSLDDVKRRKYDALIKKIHTRGDLVTLEDVPHLNAQYKIYLESSAPLDLFLYWVKRLYPEKKLKDLNNFYQLSDEPLTREIVESFKLHWQYFDDPTLWYELPNGSCIVVDECQQFFPRLSPTGKKPLHYTQFETHRHKGVDVHLVTQNEKFLDSHIRGLTHRHIHYYNKFGGKRLYRIEASMCFDSTSTSDLNATPSVLINRDAKYYGVYWSADSHTHKLRIPRKLIIWGSIAALSILVILYSGYSFYVDIFAKTDKKTPEIDSSSSSPVHVASASFASPPAVVFSEFHSRLSHPLSNACASMSYAGYSMSSRGRTVSIKHFFNCDLDDFETVSTTVESESGESKTQETRYQKSVVYTVDELSLLGYQFQIKDDLIFMIYNAQKIAFKRF